MKKHSISILLRKSPKNHLENNTDLDLNGLEDYARQLIFNRPLSKGSRLCQATQRILAGAQLDLSLTSQSGEYVYSNPGDVIFTQYANGMPINEAMVYASECRHCKLRIGKSKCKKALRDFLLGKRKKLVPEKNRFALLK